MPYRIFILIFVVELLADSSTRVEDTWQFHQYWGTVHSRSSYVEMEHACAAQRFCRRSSWEALNSHPTVHSAFQLLGILGGYMLWSIPFDIYIYHVHADMNVKTLWSIPFWHLINILKWLSVKRGGLTLKTHILLPFTFFWPTLATHCARLW